MAFLTVAGVDLLVTQMVEREPEKIGESKRAYSGRLRSNVLTVKRVWDVTVYDVDDADYQTFFDAVSLGQQVACSGDALDAAYTCEIEIQNAPFIRVRDDFVRQFSFTMRQV